MISGKLQRHFILYASFDSTFIKFITQSGATWRKLSTWTLLSMNAKGSSANDVQQNQSGQTAK